MNEVATKTKTLLFQIPFDTPVLLMHIYIYLYFADVFRKRRQMTTANSLLEDYKDWSMEVY